MTLNIRPILCLVTDRRRLAEAVGRPFADAHAILLEQIEGAVAGGVDLVQIRERDLEAGALASLVRDAVRLAAGSSTRVVVNDRVDVAVAAGAAGVHLRETSLSVTQARALAHELLIGRSVHSERSIVAAQFAEYLIAGTVFDTASKPLGGVPLGAGGLAAMVRAAGATPVLAIGGVTEEHLGSVVRAGAAGVAAIGAFLPAASDGSVASAVRDKAKKIRFAFDSAATVF